MSSSSNEPDSGSCLVARAMPCTVSPAPVRDLDLAIVTDDASKGDKSKIESTADALADSLRKLTMNSTSASLTFTSMSKKSPKAADPADFVTLQSLRSSALARKTNTTSKFGRDGAALFADLLQNEKEEKETTAAETTKKVEKQDEPKDKDRKSSDDVAEKENQKEKVEKSNVDEKIEGKLKDGEKAEGSDDYLLSRGPVRASRANTNFHPYGAKSYPNSNESYDQMCPSMGYPGTVNEHYPQEYSQWNGGHDMFSNTSSPDTVSSDLGYSSSSTSPHLHPCASTACTLVNEMQTAGTSIKDDTELPDALSDFILKYSRNYRGPRSKTDVIVDETSGSGMSPKTGRPASVESNLCDSPLSAGSAPQSSPAAPHGGITGPSTPINEYRGCNRMGPLRTQLPSGQYTAYLGRQNDGQPLEQHARPAKELLRSLIRTEEMDDAWAWTSKCMQNYPGALCYQDKDRDTLLHIVTDHLDLGKIYALVEQMLKTEYPGHQKPFDMKNRMNATPLFLAVEKRRNEIVDYLLEAGADPNTQNSKSERDAPLHYAASRGLSDIVKTICSYNTTNLNLTNGMGLTPLLCAIKNHGVFYEEGGYVIDNTSTIQMLLKYGADPMIPDATNGRTAMHYAVDRMSTEIIDVFKDNLDEETMTNLVNQPDNSKETALENVQQLAAADESTRFKLCLSLIICGANNTSGQSIQ
ncbi:Nuclear factor NF-kappa-B subunit [Aphelenchoides besseyi]|nr:Nuclear factor NF-kappa-B subunit [Aphelenchoides besseyi]